MSKEGYQDIAPTAPPQEEVQQVQYINSYPNNYIYHNPTELLRLQKEQLDKETALQIQRMENAISLLNSSFCVRIKILAKISKSQKHQ